MRKKLVYLIMILYACLIICCLFSCKFPTGPTGPVGPMGPVGPAGQSTIVKIMFVPHTIEAKDLAFNSNNIVSVGLSGKIYYSTDGKTWALPSSKPSDVVTLNGVTCGNNIFIAVGNGGIIFRSSDNGNNWVKINNSNTTNLLDVAYGNGYFIAVGNSGSEQSVRLVSSDYGLTWNITNVTSYNYSTVSYANGKFFIGTNDGELFLSTNGTSWNGPIDPLSQFTHKLLNVYYGNGIYMLSDTYGSVATSLNGTSWELLYPSWQTNCPGFCFADKCFALLTELMILWPYDRYTWLFPCTELPTLTEQRYTSIHYVPWLNNGLFLIIINLN
ncbi:MAG: hypothetical protein N3A58_05910 [Spirochaetes bacterium]|nr:hypothetical protein [Spirochaetota bacterium]